MRSSDSTNPPSEPEAGSHAERELDQQPEEQSPEQGTQEPDANPEPTEEPEPQDGEPEQTEGAEQQNEVAPIEPPVTEQEPEPVPPPAAPEEYLIFSFSYGAPPKVLHAFSNRDLRLLIRDLMRDEQQFLYIVRGGELARLLKTKRGLTLQFEEPKSRFRVPFAEQGRPVENGWMGEPD